MGTIMAGRLCADPLVMRFAAVAFIAHQPPDDPVDQRGLAGHRGDLGHMSHATTPTTAIPRVGYRR